METKKCTTCGQHKPHSDFYKSKKSADGLRYQCKACSNSIKQAWRAENPEKVADQKRRYKKRNPDKVKAQKARTQARRLTNVNGQIDADIRMALNINMRFLLRYGKDVYQLLGYDAADLMAALEGKFQPRMNWRNYGINGWHVDHIFPLSRADYDSPECEAFKKVWSLDNLQPLWAEENIAKSDILPVAEAA